MNIKGLLTQLLGYSDGREGDEKGVKQHSKPLRDIYEFEECGESTKLN